MGFYDAFNLDQDWFADSYLAIDQGPIICMIENHRTALLWDLFMSNPEIQPALDAIGFVEDVTAVNNPETAITWEVFPNPASDFLHVEFYFDNQKSCSLEVLDVHGRQVLEVFKSEYIPSRRAQSDISLGGLVPGVYFLQLKSGNDVYVKRFVKN